MQERRTGFYGWVIVISAFLITFITCGVNFSYGVFFLPIINEFGWSRGLASAVMLAAGGIYAATLPLTGIWADRYGYRWVLAVSTGCLALGLITSSFMHELWQFYICTGLLVGLSIAASFAIPVALVALWFNQRQGLALGVATLGISLGTAVIPLLISYMITSTGWRNTMLIAGIAVAAVCLPAALLMRSPPRRIKTNQASPASESKEVKINVPSELETGLTLAQAVRTGQFWMLFLCFLLFLGGLGLVMLHMVPYAVDSGMAPVEGALLLTLIGVFGSVGRLASGIISDRAGYKPVMIFCSILLALNIAFIAYFNTPWAFYVFASVYGISYAGFVTQMVRITRGIFGALALGSVFGALMVSDGLGFGLGPWIAGNVFDATGSYQASFTAAAVGLVISAILTIIIRPVKTQANS